MFGSAYWLFIFELLINFSLYCCW